MSPSALRETTLIDCFTESVGDQETKLQKKKKHKKKHPRSCRVFVSQPKETQTSKQM